MKAGRPPGTFKGQSPSRVNGKVTTLYNRWQSMMQRCYNKSSHNYAYYGGRGIAVCDQWRCGNEGFQRFALDMGKPDEGLTLGRIDNAKGYAPENCRWETWKQQANNREQGGKKNIRPDSLRQRALAAGFKYHVVYQRVKIHGWSEEKAFSTPTMKPGRYNRLAVTQQTART